MEAIMAILRMMIADYLDAEMNCSWCVFFVDSQQMKWGVYNIGARVQGRIF